MADVANNLNLLLGSNSDDDMEVLSKEVKLLDRVRNYEELKEAIKDLAPYLALADSLQSHEDEDTVDDDVDVADERFGKRAMEEIDKEVGTQLHISLVEHIKLMNSQCHYTN